MPLGDRLADAVRGRRSQLVLGIDPDPGRLWPRALELAGQDRSAHDDDPSTRTGRAVAAHCRLLLDAAGDQCVAIKPQVACFERLGAPGWAALRELVADAHERGLLVVADAKRGDIDISATAYGHAFFTGVSTPYGHVPGLGADLLTASPLLGRDSIAALLGQARTVGGGLLLLTRTSNPGAADLQGLMLRDGGTVSEAIAALVDAQGRDNIGRSGLSDVGAVTGATAPEHLERLRELMPAAVMLLPGLGAQGGDDRGLRAAFAPGPAGGLVPVSRGIAYAFEGAGRDPADAAANEARRLRELLWDLYA
ncbi:MAG TPA: orotidine-5'-phosphate decarboxylase [Solirubrobacteraceae bacterium]|nr:orotidine-5'-phosphate decarboxylase [Solirubrobacteraceae bacterium]